MESLMDSLRYEIIKQTKNCSVPFFSTLIKMALLLTRTVCIEVWCGPLWLVNSGLLMKSISRAIICGEAHLIAHLICLQHLPGCFYRTDRLTQLKCHCFQWRMDCLEPFSDTSHYMLPCFTLKPVPWHLFSSEIEDMMPIYSRVFPADSLERVTCRVPHGHPEPEVWWEHAGQRVPAEGRVYQDGLNLIFSPTRGEDSGTYTCFAQNKAGQRKQELTVTVASKSSARNMWMQVHVLWCITCAQGDDRVSFTMQ